MKSFLVLSMLSINFIFHSQNVIWQDDFENPGTWILNSPIGPNGLDANSWFISDAEGGVAPGNCGIAGNGNKT